ncbi:polyhydroxyalkanoate synthesis repressor PhaR [Komagataeibacter swingsii]|uniref:Polyhydroxyalkanoate synthesis repressor PhaR n=1 Tax=Komagataeibacter swingsii TaxID=215220 RepID=A0A2V4RQ65_9PROT|nr:polyhydroxyalkanoate synthesis repressor PhaR [Komagataeibacter swingsii]PYD71290.1 polyhydroxyalkanoate synthesis repressor PhaR [Komagataeibacter swingsii]GBQ62732.1 methyl-accepting chemotaxis protein [Komagataeibacter swingsii DSM 16373]
MSVSSVPVIIKKYANRRLYDTELSAYITLENLMDMVKQDRAFVILDARTGDDITRGVLAQVMLEEETRGRAMLPVAFLRQLIRCYGDSRQGEVSDYLERMMAEFMDRQPPAVTPDGLEELGRENAAVVRQAMSLFTSLYAVERVGNRTVENLLQEIMDLRQQVAALQGSHGDAPDEKGSR